MSGVMCLDVTATNTPGIPFSSVAKTVVKIGFPYDVVSMKVRTCSVGITTTSFPPMLEISLAVPFDRLMLSYVIVPKREAIGTVVREPSASTAVTNPESNRH